MNGLRKKVFSWVSGTHVAVLLLLLVVPLIKGCFHKEPKIIATFDLGALPPPEPDIPDVPDIPEPKPEPKPEPVKKPVPKPAPTNTPPKTVKTNAPPKKAEEKKPDVKPAPTNKPPKAVTNAPPKPKTLEERMAEIRKSGKPVNKTSTASKPSVDYSGLKSTLDGLATGTSGSGSGSGGGGFDPFGWYYDRIKQQMYGVWQQPAGAPVGLTAEATIRIDSSGRVLSKSITRRSGNPSFDQSVQNALNSTTQLPAPPSGLSSRTIVIEFALSD